MKVPCSEKRSNKPSNKPFLYRCPRIAQDAGAVKRWFFLCFMSLLLSACSQQSTLPPLPAQSTQPIPQTWVIAAKLGIRSRDESGSVTLKWQQQGQEYQINLAGPLGQGSALLMGNADYIVIDRPNQERIYSNNPTQLVQETFGWELPLEQLNYWVRGLATPTIDTRELTFTPSGAVATFEQLEWSLQYSRHTLVDQWLMPKRIQAKKDDTIFTLIINEWAFPREPLNKSGLDFR
jgi:outer membrane lipoprotein LolB